MTSTLLLTFTIKINYRKKNIRINAKNCDTDNNSKQIERIDRKTLNRFVIDHEIHHRWYMRFTGFVFLKCLTYVTDFNGVSY